MTKSREKEREILLTSVLKIGLWENRPITGTKAWENIHIRNKGVRDFPYRGQRLGNALLISKGRASRQNIPYKGWWNLLEVSIVLPDNTSYHSTTSQYLFISKCLLLLVVNKTLVVVPPSWPGRTRRWSSTRNTTRFVSPSIRLSIS